MIMAVKLSAISRAFYRGISAPLFLNGDKYHQVFFGVPFFNFNTYAEVKGLTLSFVLIKECL